MDMVTAIILGIIQGATEWLPVSSSGHLVIAQTYLGVTPPVFFDLLLHVGTLASVMLYFRKEVREVRKALLRLVLNLARGPKRASEAISEDPNQRMALFLAVGTLPIALLGYLLESWIEASFKNIFFVGLALLATGTVLFPTYLWTGRKGIKDMRPRSALVVGLAQAAALFPGISRSGMSISFGLFLGLDKRTATRYSFLLAIPAILGATLYHGYKLALGQIHILPYMVVGMVVSAVVGYLAIWPVLYAVRERKLHIFSPYCWGVGGIIILLSFL